MIHHMDNGIFIIELRHMGEWIIQVVGMAMFNLSI